jgi:hypothetical protein
VPPLFVQQVASVVLEPSEHDHTLKAVHDLVAPEQAASVQVAELVPAAQADDPYMVAQVPPLFVQHSSSLSLEPSEQTGSVKVESQVPPLFVQHSSSLVSVGTAELTVP